MTGYYIANPNLSLSGVDSEGFGMPCFTLGTNVLTPEGYVRVQDLAVGQMVRTHFDGVAAIRWIGYRQIDCGRHPNPQMVWPVQVKAGAFGDENPRRALGCHLIMPYSWMAY
jgi:hypothetical protein